MPQYVLAVTHPNPLRLRGQAEYASLRDASDHALALAVHCGTGSIIIDAKTGHKVGTSSVPPRSRHTG